MTHPKRPYFDTGSDKLVELIQADDVNAIVEGGRRQNQKVRDATAAALTRMASANLAQAVLHSIPTVSSNNEVEARKGNPEPAKSTKRSRKGADERRVKARQYADTHGFFDNDGVLTPAPRGSTPWRNAYGDFMTNRPEINRVGKGESAYTLPVEPKVESVVEEAQLVLADAGTPVSTGLIIAKSLSGVNLAPARRDGWRS